MRIKLSLLMLLCMALPSLAATGLTGTLVDARTGKAVADAISFCATRQSS